MTVDVLHFRQPQTRRLARFGVAASVDLHCHVLPGIDDGPATLDDSLALCDALANDGITTVIATAHQLGSFDHVTSSAIRAATQTLSAALVEHHIPLVVRPGAELRIEDGILRRMAADEVLMLPDGGAYLLLELPHSTLFEIGNLIDALATRGWTPVIAHPERNGPIAESPALLGPWIGRGAIVQITAGSLTGEFGATAMRAAWDMLNAGWVSVIATDAHDAIHRPPAMSAAIDRIAARAGHAVARRLCVTNPLAIFQAQPIVRPRIIARPRGRG